MTRCPNHWRGKHDWRGPHGARVPPGGPFSGIVGGSFSLLHCGRCGVGYATASARPGALTLRDVVEAVDRERAIPEAPKEIHDA